MTHYKTLEIEPNATQEDIKKAYRILSKKNHPDINPANEQLFIKIKDAYEILSNPNERAAYDSDLAKSPGGNPEFRGGQNTDIFSNIFNKRNDGPEPRKGKNRNAATTISFAEAATGIKKEIRVRVKKDCLTCAGKGKITPEDQPTCTTCGGSKKIITETVNAFGHPASTTRICPDCRNQKTAESDCEDCSGRGYHNDILTAEVVIPAGVETNSRVRMKGLGEKGEHGGDNGDLIVTIVVEENDLFERRDNCLHFTQEVSFAQLVLGAKLEIPTLEGTTVLAIPKGTEPNTEIRLKGLGISTGTDYRKGDLVVTLKLKIPTELTQEQEQALLDLGL